MYGQSMLGMATKNNDVQEHREMARARVPPQCLHRFIVYSLEKGIASML